MLSISFIQSSAMAHKAMVMMMRSPHTIIVNRGKQYLCHIYFRHFRLVFYETNAGTEKEKMLVNGRKKIFFFFLRLTMEGIM